MVENQTQPLILTKRFSSTKSHVAHTASEINAAKRAVSGAGNHGSSDHRRIAKLDREPDAVAPPTLKLDVGKAIQKKRMELELSQKDLGTKINEKQSIVNDYEMSRGIPNQQVLMKMEKVLGIKLRGKNIGEAFDKK